MFCLNDITMGGPSTSKVQCVCMNNIINSDAKLLPLVELCCGLCCHANSIHVQHLPLYLYNHCDVIQINLTAILLCVLDTLPNTLLVL